MPPYSAAEKDHGYAWLVLLASFLHNMLDFGVFTSPAIYMIEWMEEFNASKAQVALIGSIEGTVGYCIAILGGPLVERYGCRRVSWLGSVIVAMGFILSSFATSIVWLWVSFGIIVGIGDGLSFIPPAVIIQYYFDKKRALSAGLASCGFSVGSFVVLPAIRVLISYYGWRGAMVVHCGLTLNTLVCGAIYRETEELKFERKTNRSKLNRKTPITMEETTVAKEHRDATEAQIRNDSHIHLYPKDSTAGDTTQDLNQNVSDLSTKNTKTREKNFMLEFLRRTWNFALFYQPAFVLFFLGETLADYGDTLMTVFTPTVAILKGVTKEEAAMVISLRGLVSTGSRLLFSFVVNISEVLRVWLCGVTIVIQGVLVVTSCFATTFHAYAIIFAIYGFSAGPFTTAGMTLMVDLVGLKNVTHAYTFCNLGLASTFLASVPLTGLIIDETGDLDLPYYLFGGVQCLAGILICSIYFVNKRGTHQDNWTPQETATAQRMDLPKKEGQLEGNRAQETEPWQRTDLPQKQEPR